MKQGYSHGHPYVEIGGVKWATMNVGAKDVTDGGLYFAWGETKGYSREEIDKVKGFTWENYKFGHYCNIKKYNGKDKLKTLQPQDDPVHVNWRGGLRLPTKEEFAALKEATTSEWVHNYQGSGVNGLLVKDRSDLSKQLFFPAMGYVHEKFVKCTVVEGNYWSLSLHSVNCAGAWFICLDGTGVIEGYCYRDYGFSVRGVLD